MWSFEEKEEAKQRFSNRGLRTEKNSQWIQWTEKTLWKPTCRKKLEVKLIQQSSSIAGALEKKLRGKANECYKLTTEVDVECSRANRLERRIAVGLQYPVELNKKDGIIFRNRHQWNYEYQYGKLNARWNYCFR